ncbi:hydantoinase [Gammaproteobacteria bacterium 45_16_T64]|nr:hydantoinase [Gammaproteobacteria bacterium 45_16_T64]
MTLGVDTGGTFTDFVLLASNTLRIHKVLSTPKAPEQAIIQGIQEMGLMEAAIAGKLHITHGSTVATNAALENKGVKTAFITNQGFADLLTIGRQARPELYNLQPILRPAPVEKSHCIESEGRLDAEGNAISPLTPDHIQRLVDQLKVLKPESVAICHLFSFLNPQHEIALEAALSPYFYVSRSSKVLPTTGEYERGIATWLNASLGPLVKRYIDRLLHALEPAHIAVMQSTGGTIDANQAGDHAVKMLLSGPAGGLSGARFIGNTSNIQNLLTFDMGGTSTDVATIQQHVKLTTEGHIGPWPVAVPQVDMHTIGAGGGSIAYIDAGGLLQVGPASAGADPGPACYGKGGRQPTVTDANAVLGRLRPELFLGGKMDLDVEAARQSLAPIANTLSLSIEEAAQGIIDIANEHMVNALRVISVQRGYDIHNFHLCCFGGAGGLHVCALANTLQMNRAIVPIHGGVLSAFGMLASVKERQLSLTVPGLVHSNDTMQAILDGYESLMQQGTQELTNENVPAEQIRVTKSVDLRYKGQSFFLNIPWQADTANISDLFHQQHEHRYGHRLDIPIELVNIRIALSGPQPKVTLPTLTNTTPGLPLTTVALFTNTASNQQTRCPIYQRESLAPKQQIQGPALIAETISTTFIDHGWVGIIDTVGNILLEKT